MVCYFALSLLCLHPHSTIFQRSVAFLHFANTAREYLELKLSNIRIRESGPIFWLARSPDLVSCYFFLCEYVVGEVVAECLASTAGVESKSPEMTFNTGELKSLEMASETSKVGQASYFGRKLDFLNACYSHRNSYVIFVKQDGLYIAELYSRR